MSQRASGYARRPDEAYDTPSWHAPIIADWLKGEGLTEVWEPAVGAGLLAAALEAKGIRVFVSNDNFFSHTVMPEGIRAVATSPPYGSQGRLAADFVRHAFKLKAE
jgi:hypothetical protein